MLHKVTFPRADGRLAPSARAASWTLPPPSLLLPRPRPPRPSAPFEESSPRSPPPPPLGFFDPFGTLSGDVIRECFDRPRYVEIQARAHLPAGLPGSGYDPHDPVYLISCYLMRWFWFLLITKLLRTSFGQGSIPVSRKQTAYPPAPQNPSYRRGNDSIAPSLRRRSPSCAPPRGGGSGVCTGIIIRDRPNPVPVRRSRCRPNTSTRMPASTIWVSRTSIDRNDASTNRASSSWCRPFGNRTSAGT